MKGLFLFDVLNQDRTRTGGAIELQFRATVLLQLSAKWRWERGCRDGFFEPPLLVINQIIKK
jgi:hypothetical protein